MTCWCGEEMAGDARHRKRGEDPCAPSHDALLAYRRAWRDRHHDHLNAKKRARRAERNHSGLWITGEEVVLPEVDPL